MTHIEVLKQALEALQKIYIAPEHEEYIRVWWPACEEAITSLRQAIAEAEDNYQGSDAAKATHMMDLYVALGVKWGEDPFAVIAKMRDTFSEAENQPDYKTLAIQLQQQIAQAEKQEPVAKDLLFNKWTADKKDLSDYVCVGSLTLAGIEDGEYGQSEIDSDENVIEKLQEKLVTSADHKNVPLLAYIGTTLYTHAQPTQPETEKQEQPLPPVEIGVDVTSEGAHVVAFYRKPDAVMEVFYSQFHSAPQRQWVGLDQEEIKKASLKAGMQEHYMDFHSGFIRFANEIEATLRNKNT